MILYSASSWNVSRNFFAALKVMVLLLHEVHVFTSNLRGAVWGLAFKEATENFAVFRNFHNEVENIKDKVEDCHDEVGDVDADLDFVKVFDGLEVLGGDKVVLGDCLERKFAGAAFGGNDKIEAIEGDDCVHDSKAGENHCDDAEGGEVCVIKADVKEYTERYDWNEQIWRHACPKFPLCAELHLLFAGSVLDYKADLLRCDCDRGDRAFIKDIAE